MRKKMMEIDCHSLVCNPVFTGHMTLDLKMVEKLMTDFHEDLITPPTVVFVNGNYYLMGGVHLIEAMKRLYVDREHPVLCKVYFCSGRDEAWKIIDKREKKMRIRMRDKIRTKRLVAKRKKEQANI